MAFDYAASSSFVLPRKKYDVFISFRGEDTRDNFTSHLHAALLRRNIETYIDYRLEKGDEVWPALEEAIENSYVFLVVFSENYAYSKWCLNELTKIMERREEGHVVIPVFYRTYPSHVRKQSGSYEKAFAKHELNFRLCREKLESWKFALTKAADLSGWDSRDRVESELIDDIVKDLLQKLGSRYPSDELKGIIGVDENYAQVESLLRMQESKEILRIGLWGMGGIGKTTIATALFAKLSSQFESRCFLENVREESKKHGPNYLMNKLISELCGRQYGTPMIGSRFSKDQFIRKKVFLVLDDVDTSEQMEYLFGALVCLWPGSRVIVTSRDKHVLSGGVDEIYEVKALNFKTSLHLLSLHAFKQNHPTEGYRDLSNSAVSYAQGVPLALTVLGSFLRSKSKKEWESALEKLKKIPHVRIHNVLKLSYDGLDDKEQDIFLDIACFLKGENKEDAIKLLDSFGFFGEIGIRTLLDRALITISESNTIWMHDLIQETGREIVRQQSTINPGRRSRLWDEEEIRELLENDMGTETIEGIMLNVSKIRDISLSSDAFTKMSRLRFLKFFTSYGGDCKVHLHKGLKSLPRNLRYFRWDKYPSSYLPSTFCAEKLVELSMANSSIEKLWEGVQNVVNLRKFDLKGCKYLVELPDMSRALNLEYMWLQRCQRLHHLHPSILSLYTLVELDLTECTELESLQRDIHFKSVAFLCLSKCTRLQEISVTDELPSSIPLLHKLEKLDLWRGEDVENIPNQLQGLRSLYRFDLSDCNLIKLPNDICFLSSLRELSLSGNESLEGLPRSIKNLSHMKTLDISHCRRLKSLPQLPLSIQILNANNCISLQSVYNPMLEVELIRRYLALHQLLCFSFINCMVLYEQAMESIMAYVHIGIKQAMKTYSPDSGASSGRVYVDFPGCLVPKWFSYRTTEGSLTMDLPLHCSFEGFIFYIVRPWHCRYEVNSLCKFSMEASNGEEVDYISTCPGKGTSNLAFNHASLWYDPKFNHEIVGAIQRSRALDPCATPCIKVSFQFYMFTEPRSSSEELNQLAEGGVHPIYASEYDNFLKQTGLDLDFGNKTKRSRDTDDDLDFKTSRIGVEGCEFDEQKLLPFTAKKSKKSMLQHLALALQLEQGTEINIDELEQGPAAVGVGGSNQENQHEQQVLHHRTNKLNEFTFLPLSTEGCMQNGRTELKELHFL